VQLEIHNTGTKNVMLLQLAVKLTDTHERECYKNNRS
jgi:hypothetical protein